MLWEINSIEKIIKKFITISDKKISLKTIR